jgi:hypothetical protein
MTTNAILYPGEEDKIQTLLQQWGSHIVRNQHLSDHYNGKVPVKDIGISVPPPLVNKLSRCSVMWCKQAVKRLADLSIIEGYDFTKGNSPAGFDEAWQANDIIDLYDETLPSQLQHGPAFWTVTAGDDNEPAFIVSSYDAQHATALYDYRHRQVLCGLAIVDVDTKHPDKATAYTYYAENGDIVEFELLDNGEWISRRLENGTGKCLLTAARTEPDKQHPFGQSVITNSILSLEEEANRQCVRMVLHSELFTSPTRWVLGANDDIFENGRWEAYLGSIFALPSIDSDGENLPQTGQYAQASIQPHISYIRQLASQFAAEANIPIHSLLYTDANPASAEAIAASKDDLVERTRKVNRLNGQTLHDIALLALSLQTETPVAQLSPELRSFSIQWRNPLLPTLAASADAAQKTAAAVPGFAGTPTYWRMLGYTDNQIAEINKEILENLQR